MTTAKVVHVGGEQLAPSIEAEGGVVDYDANSVMADEMADVDMEDKTAVVETANVDYSSLVLFSTHFNDFQDALPGGTPACDTCITCDT